MVEDPTPKQDKRLTSPMPKILTPATFFGFPLNVPAGPRATHIVCFGRKYRILWVISHPFFMSLVDRFPANNLGTSIASGLPSRYVIAVINQRNLHGQVTGNSIVAVCVSLQHSTQKKQGCSAPRVTEINLNRGLSIKFD